MEPDDLQTALANAKATLAQILASPKPTYTVEGQTVNWTEYQKMLMDNVAALKQLQSQAPYEFISRGL